MQDAFKSGPAVSADAPEVTKLYNYNDNNPQYFFIIKFVTITQRALNHQIGFKEHCFSVTCKKHLDFLSGFNIFDPKGKRFREGSTVFFLMNYVYGLVLHA